MSELLAQVDLQASGQYVVETISFTVEGALVMDGRPDVLLAGASAEEVGSVVRQALARSHRHMPLRSSIARPDAEFLATLGYLSFGKYMKGVRSLSINSDERITAFELTPYANEGPRGGFTEMIELVHTVPFVSIEQLGRDVLAALEQATP